MKKRILIGVIALLLALGPMSGVLQAINLGSEPEVHFKAIVADGHNDTMMRVIDRTTWLPEVDIGQEYRQLDIPKMQRGGLDVPFFGAYQSGYVDNDVSISRTLALINALYWTVERNPDAIGLARSVQEIRHLVQRDRKIAAVATIEGAYSLQPEDGIELLRQYYDLGVRVIGLTHNNSNALGEGLNRRYPDGTPSSGGLTDFGREAIEEMNRLGILVDVSHLTDETFWGVIEASEVPIIASHSACRGLRDHARNLTDDMIVAIAEKGGVVHINFWRSVLGPSPVTVATLVNHIDHVVNLVGVDYVGLGSDFDGASMPVDLPNASFLPRITEELISRGYSDSDIEKILGGNTLRVLKQAEAFAAGDPARVGQAPSITPSLSMGEIINDATPLLTARVERKTGSAIDESRFRVIVDGKVYTPEYDQSTSTVSLQLDQPLAEKFRVVTFEAANVAGKVAREARIFYVLPQP